MQKQLFCSILLSVLAWQLSAQQLSKVSFYRHNWSKLNPAAMPREAVEFRRMSTLITLNYRVQKHVVSSQAPKVIDGSFEKIWHRADNDDAPDNKIGLLVNAENDGIIKTSSASLNYAWMGKMGTNGRMTGRKNNLDLGYLALGFTLTYRNRRIDLNSVTWNSINRFPTDIIEHNYLNINIGGFWYWNLPERPQTSTAKEDGVNPKHAGRKFSQAIKEMTTGDKPLGYVGVSLLQPAQTQVGKTEFGNDVAQLNALAGVMYQGFEASSWVRYIPKLSFITLGERPSPVSFDVNVRYYYNHGTNKKVTAPRFGDGVWFGVGWSSAQTGNVEVGYRRWIHQGSSSLANYLQFGFAYTDVFSTANTFTKPTSFEFNVSWNFADGRKKTGKK